MTVHFNPPPGWPAPPPGWQVPPGWRPDPSWPAPPAGWPFWVEDAQRTGGARAATVAMVGGAAIAVGSFLPWVTFDSAGLTIKPAARIASAALGMILLGLAVTVRTASRGGRKAAGVFAIIVSALAFLAYSGFILIGEHGLPSFDDSGNPVTVNFSPDTGIAVMLAGAVVVFAATITAMKRPRA